MNSAKLQDTNNTKITCKEQSKKEIRKTIQFTIVSERILKNKLNQGGA